jgi:endonuclease YncB( thermonuclease family)
MNTLLTLLLLLSLLGLVVGLIRPQLFEKLFKKIPSRKQLSLIFGSICIGTFILLGILAEPLPKTEVVSDASKEQSQISEQDFSETKTPEDITEEETTNEDSAEPTPEEPTDTAVYYSVVSVVDGDTIKVNINGTTETLRLIGIDTPETVDPRKPVQCFGKEASNKAKELLTGKKVRLEADSTQGDVDKYNRLLRYAFLEDGTFFNKEMIAQGFAHEYTYQSNPYKYQADFKEAEQQAREQNKGLWNTSTCNGDTTKAVSAPTVTPTPPPASTPSDSGEPAVKKSTSNICHAKGTQYYARTKNFKAYTSIELCIASGGRLPN